MYDDDGFGFFLCCGLGLYEHCMRSREMMNEDGDRETEAKTESHGNGAWWVACLVLGRDIDG